MCSYAWTIHSAVFHDTDFFPAVLIVLMLSAFVQIFPFSLPSLFTLVSVVLSMILRVTGTCCYFTDNKQPTQTKNRAVLFVLHTFLQTSSHSKGIFCCFKGQRKLALKTKTLAKAVVTAGYKPISLMIPEAIKQVLTEKHKASYKHFARTLGQVTSVCWIMMRAEAMRAPCLT